MKICERLLAIQRKGIPNAGDARRQKDTTMLKLGYKATR
jgi:hypothetical protein